MISNEYFLLVFILTHHRVNQALSELHNRTGLILQLFTRSQLPGRLLFSPSDIGKKLSHHFLLHFPIDMGSYDHNPKY